MFSFFKSSKEKKLEKLGFQSLIHSYKEKLRNKEWTRKEYNQAVDQLFDEKKTAIDNVENINVATRQSFDDDEVMVPLNLQNIQLEYIDYDFVYNSLLFEYKNKKRIHQKALEQLENRLDQLFPNVEIAQDLLKKMELLEDEVLINKILEPLNDHNKQEFKAIYSVLRKRV